MNLIGAPHTEDGGAEIAQAYKSRAFDILEELENDGDDYDPESIRHFKEALGG